MAPIENRDAVKDGAVMSVQWEGEKAHTLSAVHVEQIDRLVFVLDSKQVIGSLTSAVHAIGHRGNGWDVWTVTDKQTTKADRKIALDYIAGGGLLRASRGAGGGSQRHKASPAPVKGQQSAPKGSKASESKPRPPSGASGSGAARRERSPKAEAPTSAEAAPRRERGAKANAEQGSELGDARELRKVREALQAKGEASVAQLMSATDLKTGAVTKALRTLGAQQGSRVGMWTLAAAPKAESVA